jgi:hypothetical protein
MVIDELQHGLQAPPEGLRGPRRQQEARAAELGRGSRARDVLEGFVCGVEAPIPGIGREFG